MNQLVMREDPDYFNRVRAFEDGLLSLMRTQHTEILDSIKITKDLTDETAGKLKAAVDAFAKSFA